MARSQPVTFHPIRITLVAIAVAVGFFFALQGSANASLNLLKPNPSDAATFSGHGGVSTDGLGQNTTGGTIQAEVPAGSTVVQAYLYGTYFSTNSPDDAQRTIDFDGTSVLLTFLQGANNLATARANVTAQVAAKVGSGGGITDFAINNDPGNLDGVALVVIYSNPALPQTTVAVLDGAAAQDGDTTTFTFAGPINPTAPGFLASMAIGSGFSFQGAAGHVCGGGQFSTINVNSQLLSSCAGNYDDGVGNNGGLITVGGVGDSFDNPTPADAPPTDDELYNLVPFLKIGDTQLVIQTANPSHDDNLFLAVIATSADARVTTEVCNDGQDNDGDGLVDKDDPDCQPPPENCTNGVDDDGDGLTDADDPDCLYTESDLTTLRVSKRGYVNVPVSCPKALRRTCLGGGLTLKSTRKLKLSRKHRARVTLASSNKRYRLKKGHKGSVRVKLSRKKLRLVKRLGKVRVTVTVKDKTPGTVPRVKQYLLKRPKK
jgi:hypothetical protein